MPLVDGSDVGVREMRSVSENRAGQFQETNSVESLDKAGSESFAGIARVATGKDAVAVFDHAYHGRTNLTMAMTAKNMPYKLGFGPFAGEVYRAPMSYPFRDGLSARRPRLARSTCSTSRSARRTSRASRSS